MSYVKPDVPRELTAPSLESQLIRRRRGHRAPGLGALGGYVRSVWSSGVGAVGAIDLGAGRTAGTLARPAATSTTSRTTTTTTVKAPTTTVKSPTTSTTSTSKPWQYVSPAQTTTGIGMQVQKPPPAPLPIPVVHPGGVAPKPSSGGSTSTSSGGGGGGGGTPAPAEPPVMPPDDPGDEVVAPEETATEKKPMSTGVKLGLVAGAGLLLYSMFAK